MLSSRARNFRPETQFERSRERFACPRSGGEQASLNDKQIAELIVGESRQVYYATRHPCACQRIRLGTAQGAGGEVHIAGPEELHQSAMCRISRPPKSPHIGRGIE